MSQAREDLARDKELLIRRSELARLQLRRQAHVLRGSLHWKRVARSAVTTSLSRRVALGLVISLAGARRTARLVMFAGRALIAARLARAIYDGARTGFAAHGTPPYRPMPQQRLP